MKIVKITIAFLLVVLVGCAAKPKPSGPVVAFFTAIKANIKSDIVDTDYFTGEVMIYDAFKNVRSDQTESSEISAKLLQLLAGFDYKILSEKVTKDKALVVVEFTTYDLASITKEWMKQYLAKIPVIIAQRPPLSAAEITKMVTDMFLAVANASKKDHVLNADIQLTLVDGKWRMDGGDANKAMFNAITGDFMSIYKDLPAVTQP
jgi:hypothetical protein